MPRQVERYAELFCSFCHKKPRPYVQGKLIIIRTNITHSLKRPTTPKLSKKNMNRLCSKTCGIDKMKKSNETKVEKIEWLKQDDLLRSEFVEQKSRWRPESLRISPQSEFKFGAEVRMWKREPQDTTPKESMGGR